MSSSFDVSGISDLSSSTIDISDLGPKSTAFPRPAVRPVTSVGRPSSRQIVQQSSVSSLSDLSGSVEIDYESQLHPTFVGGTKHAVQRTAPSAGTTQRQPQKLLQRASSFELSDASDISGSIEFEADNSLPTQLIGARRPMTGTKTGTGMLQPLTSGRPPPAPRSGAPATQLGSVQRRSATTAVAAAEQRGRGGRRLAMAGSGGGGSGDSFSISGSSSVDDVLASIDITGGNTGGGGGRGSVEFLRLDGPKVTKTHFNSAGQGPAAAAVRESTHTVVLSELDSISLSGELLGSGSGSIVIEHSEEPKSYTRTQQPFSAPGRGPTAPPTGASAGASVSLEYDKDVLGSGEVTGSMSIEYDKPSASIEATGRKMAAALASSSRVGNLAGGRPATAAAAMRYDVSKTPSISGSDSLSSIDVDSAVSDVGRGGGRGDGIASRVLPESLTHTMGSIRLSQPQSIRGLTAEPIFMSGSSQTARTPSSSTSSYGGGRGGRSSGQGGASDGGVSGTGSGGSPPQHRINLLDASTLESEIGEMHDMYDSGGPSRSLDLSGRTRGGRRVVDSGGATSTSTSTNSRFSSKSKGRQRSGGGGDGGGGGSNALSSSASTSSPSAPSQSPSSSSSSGSSGDSGGGGGVRGRLMGIDELNDVAESLQQQTLPYMPQSGSATSTGRGGVRDMGHLGWQQQQQQQQPASRGVGVDGLSQTMSSVISEVEVTGRSHSSSRSRSSSSSGGVHDLLSGMQVVRQGSGSSSSSSEVNIRTIDDLMSHSRGVDDEDGSPPAVPRLAGLAAGGASADDSYDGSDHDDGFRRGGGEVGRSRDEVPVGPSPAAPLPLAARQREFSFGRQGVTALDAAGSPSWELPPTISEAESAVTSPSGTWDASASRLSQSGALGGTSPVAPVWATTSPTASSRHLRPRGPLLGPDPYQFSRDSDMSEEFIPSQAMQRGLPEQPVFKPLMPNIPTPRVSSGALGTAPPFTTRGVASTSPSPSPSPSPDLDFGLHHDDDTAATLPSPPRSRLLPDPRYRPPPEILSSQVAAAAAPPPPRTTFAATQTDVYSEVVDLDPIPRPGTVKLRTVGMQWGTLNEAATQVAYDPNAERLVEAAGDLFDTITLQGGDSAGNLPPHLRRQLQAHLLRQQQLYGPFTKRGGGGSSGLLQAGADALLLNEPAAPFSGIGPGFGILSLAFHSVKTAALLEQLERSLSSAATVAGVVASPMPSPPPAYHHPYNPTGALPYHPYGWPWPPPPSPALQPGMTPGRAAATEYAATTAAAAAAVVAPPPPPPLPPASPGSSPGPVPPLTAVTSAGAANSVLGGSRLRSTSLSIVTQSYPPPPLAAAAAAPDTSSVWSSSAALRENSGVFAASEMPVASPSIRMGPSYRPSRLSNSEVGAVTPAAVAAALLAGPKRSISPVFNSGGIGFTSYLRSAAAASVRSSGDYTQDFEEDIMEEEAGDVGGGSGGDVETVAEEVEEEVEEVEEMIPEMDDGDGDGSSSSSSGSSSSEHYSADFDAESLAPQSRTTSFLHRSSLMGSTSRSKLNPHMSGSSFSGRSQLLRRGSVVVPTLATIAGSETTSRDDEEDGLQAQSSRVLSRVGSIIKSSSGFKRTASLSITMADDPMLPNSMARILSKNFSTNASSSAAAAAAAVAAAGGPHGLSAQPSARRLSTDDGGRGQLPHHHHQGLSPHSHGAAFDASLRGDALQAATAGQQLPQQLPGTPPPGTYSPYYAYPPYPYGMPPYGAMPYLPYPSQPPPPSAPGPPAAAASVASVLQYLPPSIPYFYPPYPTSPPAANATPNPTPGFQPAAAAPLGGATVISPRPHSSLASPGAHPHMHQPQHHVKFADGLGSSASGGGGAAAFAAAQQPHGYRATQELATGAGWAISPPTASTPHQLGQQPPYSQQYWSGGGVPVPGFAGVISPVGSFPGYGGLPPGSSSIYSAQSTLQRFGAVLSSATFPGLDAATVRTIRSDLVKTAAAVSSQIGYEDIVAEAGAADEYRAQLARIRAQLAAARATMPSVLPSQEKVVLSRPTTTRTSGNGNEAAAVGAGLAGAKQQQGLQSGLGGGSRILTVSTPAPGSYRYTTLEDTLRLIDATRPYAVVGVSG